MNVSPMDNGDFEGLFRPYPECLLPLSAPPELIASMAIEDVEEELNQLGLDPDQPLDPRIGRLIDECGASEMTDKRRKRGGTDRCEHGHASPGMATAGQGWAAAQQSMDQISLDRISAVELFDLCASRFKEERYWEEFVRRFNRSLTRSVYLAYLRFSGDARPPRWIISELLQDVYVKILKDHCLCLRRFRGKTEVEAGIYMTHIATGITVDYLRRQFSSKRHAPMESLEDFCLSAEPWERQRVICDPVTEELAEHELIKLLHRTFTGRNSKRNILIFLLHFRGGLTTSEIVRAKICNLQPTSITHTLKQMRDKLRDVLMSKNS